MEVLLSSTALDLDAYRRVAADTILRLSQQTVAMEMIERMGYHRRDKEMNELEEQLGSVLNRESSERMQLFKLNLSPGRYRSRFCIGALPDGRVIAPLSDGKHLKETSGDLCHGKSRHQNIRTESGAVREAGGHESKSRTKRRHHAVHLSER